MDWRLHPQGNGTDPGRDPFDSSLRLDTYNNGLPPQPEPLRQPQPNPLLYPPTISSHGTPQTFLPFPQAPKIMTAPPFLVPGYLDPMNNCFIPSPTSSVLSPMNGYLVGGLGQIHHLYQNMDAGTSKSPKRCAHCNSSYTPMWRRGPQGPGSLCNACGLRNRKEEERKKAEDRLMNQTRN